MKKLCIVSLLVFAFGSLYLSCQEAMSPQETVQNNNDDGFQPVISPTYIPPPSDCEPRTPGYWKNHPDDWPAEAAVGWSIGEKYYTKAEIIEIMSSPVKNDKRITLFKALTAAWLNSLDGCNVDCIAQIGNEADEMMSVVDRLPGGLKQKASGLWWKKVEMYYLILDDYNNNGCK